ncbi:MAG: sialate O-acetylesterase [Planctomycetota bacterium]|jgi:alpha-galactosidase
MHSGAMRISSTVALAVCFCSSLALGGGVDTTKPVKVFVLAGQSNMQGHGHISLGKDGDLEYAARNGFPHLKDAGGKWAERDDVWYYHKPGRGGVQKCNLKVGLGAKARSIGPELTFGHRMGDHFKEQVILIKCAWGGQALGGPFRPPSSGNTGVKFTQTVSEVKEVLASLKSLFPRYRGQGFEIAGFFWHQGWNDGCNKGFAREYEKNMVNFIRDMRKELGKPDLPFVIATSGMGGKGASGVAGFLGKAIEPAQVAAAEKTANCTAVPTRHFQRRKPGRQKSHWHNSAESYCLVGDASAKAMIELLGK